MTPYEERLTEAVARAINRAAFDFHRNENRTEEERLWAECRSVRIAQAREAIATYRNYDEQK